MIRHYEKLGLVRPATRTGGNYRDYGAEDVRRLRFIGLARDLGIGMDAIAGVMRHWDTPSAGSAELNAFGDMLVARSRAAAELTSEFGRLRGPPGNRR